MLVAMNRFKVEPDGESVAPLYFGHPEFEGFEQVITLLPAGKAA